MAVNLQSHLNEVLTATVNGLSAPVGRAFVQVGGEVAWDDCCDGQLSLRVVTLVPVYPPQRTSPCPPLYWNANLALSVVRCVNVVSDDGTSPSAADITAESARMVTDLSEVEQAIMSLDGYRPVMGVWTPQGPLGGCAGGEWTFTVKVL